MQLLFVFANNALAPALAGMAQLSAAFGQQVSVWFQSQPPNEAMINACREAGIEAIYAPSGAPLPAGVTPLEPAAASALVAQADRVVRL